MPVEVEDVSFVQVTAPGRSDHERALFLDLLWDDAIDAQVERRAEAEVEKLRSKLLSEIDDRRAGNLKLDIAAIDARKEHFMSEGRYQGLLFGSFGTAVLALLVAIAVHHRQ